MFCLFIFSVLSSARLLGRPLSVSLQQTTRIHQVPYSGRLHCTEANYAAPPTRQSAVGAISEVIIFAFFARLPGVPVAIPLFTHCSRRLILFSTDAQNNGVEEWLALPCPTRPAISISSHFVDCKKQTKHSIPSHRVAIRVFPLKYGAVLTTQRLRGLSR